MSWLDLLAVSTEKPWISPYRFEYSLPPNSPDGDPAPDLTFPVVLPTPFMPVGLPKGERTALPVPDGGSIGDEFAVEDPDRERFADI